MSKTTLKKKFMRLLELQAQAEQAKAILKEKDQLESELLPLFVSEGPKTFQIRKSFTVGRRTFEITPAFVKETKKRGREIVGKAWKSTPVQVLSIS